MIYGCSSVVGRVLNYLLIAFYTSKLVPADYGLLTEWYAYAAFLQILYTYGMETVYFRFAKKTPAVFDLVVSTLLVSSLVFSSLLIFFATPITIRIAHPGCEWYVYYFAAILAVDAVLAIPFAQLRLQKKAVYFAWAKFLQIGLNIVFNLVLLHGCAQIYAGTWLVSLQPYIVPYYHPERSVAYIFVANLLANFAVLPLFSKTFCAMRLRWSWSQLKPMLMYAWPLMLMGLAGTVNEMMGRVMLRHCLPPDFYPGQSSETVLGVFGACYKLATLMLLSIQTFRYAAEPFFFTHARTPQYPTLLRTVMHWFVLGECFLLFAVSVNLELLARLLLRKAEYWLALAAVPYLMLGYLFLGIYYNLSVWFKLTDQTYYGAMFTGIGALITMVCNRLLIPKIGYWGNVWTAVISYATMCFVCYYWGQKYYPISYRLGHKLAYVLVTMVCVHLVRRITYTNELYATINNLMLTCCFGGVLYTLGQHKSML